MVFRLVVEDWLQCYKFTLVIKHSDHLGEQPFLISGDPPVAAPEGEEESGGSPAPEPDTVVIEGRLPPGQTLCVCPWLCRLRAHPRATIPFSKDGEDSVRGNKRCAETSTSYVAPAKRAKIDTSPAASL